jgi:hypothetical protein
MSSLLGSMFGAAQPARATFVSALNQKAGRAGPLSVYIWCCFSCAAPDHIVHGISVCRTRAALVSAS